MLILCQEASAGEIKFRSALQTPRMRTVIKIVAPTITSQIQWIVLNPLVN